MRPQIEQLVAAQRQARAERAAVDQAEEPRDWAQADLDLSAATGELTNLVLEAARRLGLVRDLSRALGGTGWAVGRLAFESDVPQLHVEIQGGPDHPAERRRATDPATAERIRTVTEEFYSRTGMEIIFPYDRLHE
jgi:hypothetical protein